MATVTRVTTSRRRVLQSGLAWAAVPSLARVLEADDGPRRSSRTLVLLHLSGGNDGLNTIVPYRDPLYHELRPSLSAVAGHVLDIDGRFGFHPAFSGMARLFEAGRLAVVHGVGSPQPDYSHVGSCRIWTTGETDPGAAGDWWERVIPTGAEPHAALSVPLPHRPGEARRVLRDTLRRLRTPGCPPLIRARIGGFDTHERQLDAHACVLSELGDALFEFQAGLEQSGHADRVLLMAWSEFGRRPAENAAAGTDHGAAGPVFLMGRAVSGGLWGEPPSLDALDEFGNLQATTDFRDVCRTLAADWLGRPMPHGPAGAVLKII